MDRLQMVHIYYKVKYNWKKILRIAWGMVAGHAPVMVPCSSPKSIFLKPQKICIDLLNMNVDANNWISEQTTFNEENLM